VENKYAHNHKIISPCRIY